MAEELTRQGEDRSRLDMLAHAVNSVSEAVIVAEAPGVIVYANQAAAVSLGARAEELIGRSAAEFVPPAALEEVADALRARGPGGHACAEAPVRKLSGETFPAEVSVTVFDDDRRGLEMGIVILRDLTEAKRMEAERSFRERQLALMLREAHHRIRNNLQVASDLLALQGAGSTPEVREALDAAAARIRALAAVHDGLSADQDMAQVQARPLIEAVVSDLGARGAGVRLGLAIDEQPVTSRAASALALIAAELVRKALERGHPQAVTVRFEASGEQAVLEVSDDGASGSASADEPADGFGLKLVRLLAEEQLGGRFTLERAKDRTVSRVTFPTAGACGS